MTFKKLLVWSVNRASFILYRSIVEGKADALDLVHLSTKENDLVKL